MDVYNRCVSILSDDGLYALLSIIIYFRQNFAVGIRETGLRTPNNLVVLSCILSAIVLTDGLGFNIPLLAPRGLRLSLA